MDWFLGTILPWASPRVPDGWALCNGAFLPTYQNQALFSLVGYAYGQKKENNTDYFALPDLRGRTPIGAGVNSKHQCNYQLGGTNINEGFVKLDINYLPIHTHAAAVIINDGEVNVDISKLQVTTTISNLKTTGSFSNEIPATKDKNAQSPSKTPYPDSVLGPVGGTSAGPNLYFNPSTDPSQNLSLKQSDITVNATGTAEAQSTVSGSAAGTVTNLSGSVAVGSSGLGKAFLVMPPYQVINFIIAITGIYPTSF